jgi:choline dehydrogenase-like flavoprotein
MGATDKTFDAVVIGSGAAGSFAAMELTAQGLEVLLLEAGREITTADFPTDFAGPKEKGVQLWARTRAALTGQPVQSRVAFYGAQQRHLFVNDRDHPYATPGDKPFLWIRGKQLGGRLHTFGRVLLRWSDADFKAASRDGFGHDWPLGYSDLDSHYGKVEETLGVRGCADDVPNLPNGRFAGPSRLTEAERDFKARLEAHWPNRRAVSWRYMPPNIKRVPVPLLKALGTGRLTIRTDAVVRRITTDGSTGRATGAEFIDSKSMQRETVAARLVMVCASPIESIRLLLNSAAGKHPAGLGNSSGTLGRYFMDQIPNLTMGTVPGRYGWEIDDTTPPDPYYGASGGVYIPRYRNLAGANGEGFLRGYGFQGTIGRLYAREKAPAKFGIMGFGEMLPHEDNRIRLHPTRKDRWGVPIPHIECTLRANESAMLQQQTRDLREMVQAAGLDVEFIGSGLGLEEIGRGAFPDADFFSRTLFRLNFRTSMSLGACIHESGGVRMGSNPAKSVLNGWNQCWDAPNVFVTDASSFPTGGCSGTTLTLMALSVRSAEYAAVQLRAGRL